MIGYGAAMRIVEKAQLMSASEIDRTLQRLAHEIVETLINIMKTCSRRPLVHEDLDNNIPVILLILGYVMFAVTNCVHWPNWKSRNTKYDRLFRHGKRNWWCKGNQPSKTEYWKECLS